MSEDKSEVPPVNRDATTTLHGTPMGEHLEIDPKTGMQKDYVVLTEEERKKGFVRPVRRSYLHVGKRPKFAIRDLTPEEKERYKGVGYVKFEEYPPEMAPRKGRYWSEKDLNSGCGSLTTMGLALSETYARDPKFYSGTFCCNCHDHFPVGEEGEFIWDGTNERVGT